MTPLNKKKVGRTIYINPDLFATANFYAAQTGVDLRLMIREGLKEYVKKSQKAVGIPPTQEYIEERFKHESGKRRTLQIGIVYDDFQYEKLNYELFINVIYYATQEGLTFDVLVERILLESIKKAQQEIGVFSREEINARYERAMKQTLKEIDMRS